MQDFGQARLLKRARQGDPDAFEQLVAPYEKKMFALCLRMLGHREDAQDAAQEAMLRVYRGLSAFRGEAQLSTFIYRVTANACMDALRRRRVRASQSLESLAEEGFLPADDAPSPEENLLRSEERARIAQAIGALDEPMRLPLVLREVQGLSYEEVAQALELGMGTVKSRIHRAREKLAQMLGDQTKGGDRDAM